MLCLSQPWALWTTLSKFTVQIFLSLLLIVNCLAAYPAKGDQWHFSCRAAVGTSGGILFTERLKWNKLPASALATKSDAFVSLNQNNQYKAAFLPHFYSSLSSFLLGHLVLPWVSLHHLFLVVLGWVETSLYPSSMPAFRLCTMRLCPYRRALKILCQPPWCLPCVLCSLPFTIPNLKNHINTNCKVPGPLFTYRGLEKQRGESGSQHINLVSCCPLC